MVETCLKLIECLNFQMGQKDRFFKKIPQFKAQLRKCDKSLDSISNKYEMLRRKNTYKSIIDEFKEILKRHHK